MFEQMAILFGFWLLIFHLSTLKILNQTRHLISVTKLFVGQCRLEMIRDEQIWEANKFIIFS